MQNPVDRMIAQHALANARRIRRELEADRIRRRRQEQTRKESK